MCGQLNSLVCTVIRGSLNRLSSLICYLRFASFNVPYNPVRLMYEKRIMVSTEFLILCLIIQCALRSEKYGNRDRKAKNECTLLHPPIHRPLKLNSSIIHQHRMLQLCILPGTKESVAEGQLLILLFSIKLHFFLRLEINRQIVWCCQSITSTKFHQYAVYRQNLLIKTAMLVFCTECLETQVATSSLNN